MITTASISVTVDSLSDTTQVPTYGEWLTIITLLQDGGTVIISGLNQTPSETGPPIIEIVLSVSTILHGIINNGVSVVAFDTDTTVCVYGEVEEAEDQIAEFSGMFFDTENFGAPYPDPAVNDSLVIIVNNAINERRYFADFTTTALFNRFGAEFRFPPRIRGTTISACW